MDRAGSRSIGSCFLVIYLVLQCILHAQGLKTILTPMEQSEGYHSLFDYRT